MKPQLRILCFITLIFCSYITIKAQTKRAIVIGIGNYPTENGWHKINGNNDIEIITAALNEYGFNNENVQVLKDDKATKKAIIAAFNNIIKNSAINDIAYIHFSGHGQLITDVDGDEHSGYDEAWIPFDAGKTFIKGKYEGQNHLVDDEINVLLHKLKNTIGSKGEILVVVDACHSGGSTRGKYNEDEIVRGTADKFKIPIINRMQKEQSPVNWATITACESYQNNFECKINNKNFGSLSYAIYSNKDKLNTNSYLSVFSILKNAIFNLIEYPQTPVLENGNRSNLIFTNQ